MLHWKHLLQLTDEQPATHDIAEVNLACATGLPGADQIDQNRCIVRLDHFADAVRHFTAERRESFLADPAAYHHSECVFRVMCLMTLLWQQFGIRYNPAK